MAYQILAIKALKSIFSLNSLQVGVHVQFTSLQYPISTEFLLKNYSMFLSALKAPNSFILYPRHNVTLWSQL